MTQISNISAVMILKDAEKSLRATLESLLGFEEVIILDNGSSDKSLEIAASFNNVKIFHSPFIGFGPLKNLAASYASNDWVFSIDSDEIPNEELLSEIQKFDILDIESLGIVHRVNEYLGKVISGTDWGNEYIIRLFNRSRTSFTNSEVHETVKCDDLKQINLKGELLHESYSSISEMITKMQFYTSLYAKQNLGIKKVGPLMISLKSFFAFFRSYFLKRGFLFGWRGVLVSSYVGIDVFFKYYKLYELDYKRKYRSDKKKVLVDLERLKYPNCGLGQVCINFSNELINFQPSTISYEYLLPSKSRKELIKNDRDISFRCHNVLTKNGITPIDKHIDLYHLTSQITDYGVHYAKKNIYTIHDLNFLEEKSPQKSKAKLDKIQKAVDKADVITVISKFTEKIIRSNLSIPSSKKVRVIYNGVKSPLLKDPVKPKQLGGNDKFFFTIGTVMPKKNFHVLIEMMQYFDDDIKLYIAGMFEKESYVVRIKNLISTNNLQNRIVLLGGVSDEEKSYLYSKCQAFLFPSLLEGFGLPIIESMLSKKPTFSSDKTSLPEIGDRYAYYWESFEAEYMAGIVKDGLRDFELHKEKREREMFEYASKFSWNKNAEAYAKLYLETLDSE
ncbi:glycosyltransferase [Flammeovirga pectinis]|uniref:Glycosyltransferase n=1 Tax=Flammeovirga pectinis TaxID=2494373 RepID=A0A3S9P5M9_9BACT|nr:glycosyltransferase [Flammeovirga pectinis]AZQ63516.1 glycosyltransferase [Flammeovirga pectinis]